MLLLLVTANVESDENAKGGSIHYDKYSLLNRTTLFAFHQGMIMRTQLTIIYHPHPSKLRDLVMKVVEMDENAGTGLNPFGVAAEIIRQRSLIDYASLGMV